MSTVLTDVSTIPGAQFFKNSTAFPNIIPGIKAAQQRAVESFNRQGTADFTGVCGIWTVNATAARMANQPLPPKPVSPPSWVLLTQEMPDGTWIAQSQTGPVYGVCPDLPAWPTPGTNPGGSIVGKPIGYTQDQMLESIGQTVNEIKKMLTDLIGGGSK